VRIYNIYDCHGTKHEKQRGGHISQTESQSFFQKVKSHLMQWRIPQLRESYNKFMDMPGRIYLKKCSAFSRNINHSKIAIPTAVAALFTFITSSKAMHIMPIMKTTGIR
jgi:hypothetical protein